MADSNSSVIIPNGHTFDISQFNFSDHSSNVGSIHSTNITLIVLVGTVVGLRLFVRASLVRKVFLDDILILVAAAFTVALAAVCIAGTSHGIGTHLWLLDFTAIFQTIQTAIQYLFVCQVLYACAIAFTKISIIASYIRFLPDRKFRIYMGVTSIVILGLWIAGVFVTIFQCRPVSAAWDFTDTNGKCINYVDYLYASSSLTVATDIALCILPWPYFWKLQLPLKQRIILCLLLGGGVGACIASILRIAKLHMLRGADVTYQAVPSLNLSVIECSLGIICVSIPPLRPLAVHLFPHALLSHRSSSARTPQHMPNSYDMSNMSAKVDRNMGNSKESETPSTMLWEENGVGGPGSFGNAVRVSSHPPKEYLKLNIP
ncbi:hypothetical protein BCR34DRAFT_144800 [Clohesyomyces aquaticus]|uniref:Rhodopsin domain-containing protein n=1 Tax=Clohesyomyces aquaticus TaxID=1231657 RepID=A0A1Y2A0G9_9PLEO|nr:hypothetical protein BCR34DRAFT_144800 [Clohesyomyces aquaticus]